ncbi:MAG: hypothetical protein ACLPZM_04530 [Thermoplasmata archaeon]
MVDFENVALWTTVATWVLAVGTLVVLYWQTRQAGQLHSSNAVMDLRDKFDTPRMRRIRRLTSAVLLKHAEADAANLEVPIFFELIGAQTKRKILDEEMVWEAFGGWITSYYHGMRNPIDRIQKLREAAHDPLLLAKFEWLNDRITTLDRKALGSEYPSSVVAFEEAGLLLQRETKLETE